MPNTISPWDFGLEADCPEPDSSTGLIPGTPGDDYTDDTAAWQAFAAACTELGGAVDVKTDADRPASKGGGTARSYCAGPVYIGPGSGDPHDHTLTWKWNGFQLVRGPACAMAFAGNREGLFLEGGVVFGTADEDDFGGSMFIIDGNANSLDLVRFEKFRLIGLSDTDANPGSAVYVRGYGAFVDNVFEGCHFRLGVLSAHQVTSLLLQRQKFHDAGIWYGHNYQYSGSELGWIVIGNAKRSFEGANTGAVEVDSCEFDENYGQSGRTSGLGAINADASLLAPGESVPFDALARYYAFVCKATRVKCSPNSPSYTSGLRVKGADRVVCDGLVVGAGGAYAAEFEDCGDVEVRYPDATLNSGQTFGGLRPFKFTGNTKSLVYDVGSLGAGFAGKLINPPRNTRVIQDGVESVARLAGAAIVPHTLVKPGSTPSKVEQATATTGGRGVTGVCTGGPSREIKAISFVAGSSIYDGEYFIVNGLTFTFNKGASGALPNPIAISDSDTAREVRDKAIAVMHALDPTTTKWDVIREYNTPHDAVAPKALVLAKLSGSGQGVTIAEYVANSGFAVATVVAAADLATDDVAYVMERAGQLAWFLKDDRNVAAGDRCGPSPNTSYPGHVRKAEHGQLCRILETSTAGAGTPVLGEYLGETTDEDAKYVVNVTGGAVSPGGCYKLQQSTNDNWLVSASAGDPDGAVVVSCPVGADGMAEIALPGDEVEVSATGTVEYGDDLDLNGSGGVQAGSTHPFLRSRGHRSGAGSSTIKALVLSPR